jgi:hypothetical protein
MLLAGIHHKYLTQNLLPLEFDCFQALAVDAKCSIGNQLHPCGKIDPVTYDLTGVVRFVVPQSERPPDG